MQEGQVGRLGLGEGGCGSGERMWGRVYSTTLPSTSSNRLRAVELMGK